MWLTSYSAVREVCDEKTGECFSKEHMFGLVGLMREQLAQHERELATSNCTVCNIKQPCLNGGTCIPLSVNNYGCQCPEDTAGFNCEKKIKCRPSTCGENAQCFIANHKLNCVCEKGYTGDPRWGCKQHYQQTCASGDPHYSTFDGSYYDYQGTCPYVFSQPCTSLQGFSFYSVKARNKLYNSQSHVSYISEIEVVMHNKTIHIDEQMNLYVDGVNTFYPFYYPSSDNKMKAMHRSRVVESNRIEPNRIEHVRVFTNRIERLDSRVRVFTNRIEQLDSCVRESSNRIERLDSSSTLNRPVVWVQK
uniref:EGF-like domain-containing protein n=1 Tax=Steinernema glaseri TaxID=37863 RepID=A0A1I7Y7M5_9BILA